MTDSEAEPLRRQLTLGVLGHVDHGKTALVRALTGIETDRLAEERERGLSIVPGYAWFESSDVCIDLIDAPGHQAFIRAMIGAASGIDAAMLVVAANEGVMPQTREHLAVAELLKISGGIVVITKCDLVSESELEQRCAELREFFATTILRDAEIVPVAALNGTGIPALRDALSQFESRRSSDPAIPFYIPVDRSFSKSGFGRVATGTVHSGSVAEGDELIISPGAQRVSVRGIQVHGKSVDQARHGDRAALNLRGPGVESVAPGMVLGHEYAMLTSRRLDVAIEPVAEMAEYIRNGAEFRVLMGTAEAQAKLRILELETPAKHFVVAQLRCDRELPTRRGMRFILRSNSPAATVGGGSVIDALAIRRRRFDHESNAGLAKLVGADRDAALHHYVRAAGRAGIDKADLSLRLGINPNVLESLINPGEVAELSAARICDARVIDEIATEIQEVLRIFHRKQPQHSGMKHGELTAALANEPHDLVVGAACDSLKAAGVVKASADLWHLSDFNPADKLSESQRRLITRIESAFVDAGIAAPPVKDVVGENAAAREMFSYLLEKGRIVRLQTRDRSMQALHASVVESVREKISEAFPYPNEFAVKDVRDLLQTTRKYVVPLLEHLDATGFTLRKGDMRQIRQ